MNIVFFIGQLATGGAERQMVNLACGLSDIGHNVVVATIYPGGNNVKLLKENQRLSYISLWNYPSKRFIGRCFQLFFSPLILRKRINHYNPDVVYSMLHMANLIAWLSTRGKLANKLVWGIRSSNMTLNLKRAFPERVCAHVSKTVPLAISNSKSGLKYHKSRRFNPIRFETIPNGIDTNTFRFNKELRFTTRNEFGVIANQSLIGVVARLDPVKGHITFLKAAAKVSQKITDVKFVCVGSGPDDFTKKLQTLTIELGLENRVMWLGNREDTVAIYSALDLLISPSYSEAFPNVIGEAMSCGVSCVVTDVGDSAEIVDCKEHVVPPHCPEKLAEAVVAAIKNKNSHLKSNRNRHRILNHFSFDQLIQSTEELLNSSR